MGGRVRPDIYVEIATGHDDLSIDPDEQHSYHPLDVSAPAALASLLFDPPEPQIIGKTQCFATFLPFRASELLSSDSFSSLIFSLLLFSSL